jgi:uncharacterized protein (TIGR02452 family)
MNRRRRSELARETLAILEQGHYTAPSGARVELRDDMEAMLQGTAVYAPADLAALARPAPTHETNLLVTNETTLDASARLAREDRAPVLALNFASAKNPGGGFLNGAQAQEESLARATALYPSLLRGEHFYRTNRACGTCLYTDHMIYSPRVPVLRRDTGELLDQPFLVSILTAPAVNAGALKERERPELEPVMLRRSELVLALAAARGYSRLVLGAWGCGVFRNDPARVATWFAHHLRGAFSGVFAQVTFAIYDGSSEQHTLQAFERAFAPS